jgi:hypothetical protein
LPVSSNFGILHPYSSMMRWFTFLILLKERET